VAAIHLGPRLLEASCDQPEGGHGPLLPSYLVLLRVGFAQPDGHPPAGALLPHRFTLTGFV